MDNEVEVYKASIGWKIMMVIATPVFASAFYLLVLVSSELHSIQPILYIFILLFVAGFILLSLYILISMFYDRIEMHIDRIKIVSLFRTKELLFSEISGYRYLPNNGPYGVSYKPIFLLVPKDSKAEDIKIKPIFERWGSLSRLIQRNFKELDNPSRHLTAGRRFANGIFITLLFLMGYGIFVSFIPSKGYASIMLYVTVAFGLLMTSLMPWRDAAKIEGTVIIIVKCIGIFIFFSLISYFGARHSVPHLITLAIGQPYEQEVTVEKKFEGSRRRGTCRWGIKLHGHNYFDSPCVSKNVWDNIEAGNKLVIAGKRSPLGLTVKSYRSANDPLTASNSR